MIWQPVYEKEKSQFKPDMEKDGLSQAIFA